MQAHHLLSQEGISVSRDGPKLVQFGYDIDSLENLAFLPCTLQGACHMGIQPHRGDHAVPIARGPERGFHLLGKEGKEDTSEEIYDDDDHPISYHAMVAREVQDAVKKLEKKCRGTLTISESAVKTFHDLSQKILMKIYGRPTEARLTRVAGFFVLGNAIGCGGVDNVDKHDGKTPCPCKRNHLSRRHGPGQREEDIAFDNGKPYVPRPKK